MSSALNRCFVPGCPNLNGNTTNASFHEFPEELQEEWLVAIGRDRNTFVIDEVVCSEHFETSDFEDYDTIKSLKRSIIPSLNLPVEPESSFLTDPKLNSSTSEEIEQLVKKYNSDKPKPTKVISNIVCTILKPPDLSKTVALNANDEESNNCNEEPREMSTPESENESSDEYVKYENILNCRTCLSQLQSKESHFIQEICQGDKTVKEMIIYCVPSMAATLVDSDQVCNMCLESIKFCMNFIDSCLKVEAELLENQTNYSENKLGSCFEDTASDMYRHISLDHNYIPEMESEHELKSLESTIQEHVITNDASSVTATTHECLKCDRIFKTKNYLLSHIRRMHSTDSKASLKKAKIFMFDCNFCKKSFMTKLGYDLHLQLSHRSQVEKEKAFGKHTFKDHGLAASDNPSQNVENRHGFACQMCSVRFDTRKELNVHNNIHINSHLCDVCGKGFKNKANLKVHMITHNEPNTHLCHECGQRFKSKLSLIHHLKDHKPELKFRCDQCPLSFQHKYRLETHKKGRHLGLQEYMCTLCNKKFCYKTNLQGHYRLKHSDIKPFQCERCGVGFARSDYLKRHTNCGESSLKRTGCASRRKYRYKRGDSVLITCKLCSKVFKDVQMLRLHVKTHTKLRKYKCRTCNLTFTTSNNRDRHEKVHTDSALFYRCEVCFKRMETKTALEEHCLMNHEHSKKYKCHICEEVFGRKYLLHSHVAEKHGDVEDFEKETEVLYKVVLQDYLVDN